MADDQRMHGNVYRINKYEVYQRPILALELLSL